MSFKYADLRSKSDEELIKIYDGLSRVTSVGIDYYANELQRREMEKINKTMVRCTVAVTVMTAAMLILTAVNVIAFFGK